MKTRLYTTGIMVLAICFFSMKSVKCQQTLEVSTTERFIAYSLYNFSKLIKWPGSGSDQTFQIAVVGDKRVYSELSFLAKDKKINNATYRIVYCKDISEVKGYNHMIYLCNSQSANIAELGQKKEGVLVVTERDGLASQGSTINFTTNSEGKMGFEIAKDNALKNQLTIHMQLERMAMGVI